MEAVLQRARSRAFVIVLVVAALIGGFLLAGAVDGSSPASRPGASAPDKKLTAEDMLLIAAKAKNGIFMAYAGVTGPPGADHTDHATLQSFQTGVGRGISSPVGGGGREASAPSVSEVVVTKQSDKFSASLFQESLVGTSGDNVVIYFVDFKTGATYLQFELQNTLVSGFSMSAGGNVPTESLSLNFTKIIMTSNLGPTPQVVSYDLVTQKS